MSKPIAHRAFQLRLQALKNRIGVLEEFYRRINPPKSWYFSCLSRFNGPPSYQSTRVRTFHTAKFLAQQSAATASHREPVFEYQKSLTFQKATHDISELSSFVTENCPRQVVLHGYLGNRADLSKNLSFVALLSKSLDWSIQVVSSGKLSSTGTVSAHQKLKSLSAHTPVVVAGRLRPRPLAAGEDGTIQRIKHLELELDDVQCLNESPKDLIGSASDVFGPEDRHLQLRTNKSLRNALTFRADVAKCCRVELEKQHFLEVETPLLFKSTPEGAKEFIVPTRRKGLAYALPQSPQQFKQILMGSGVSRYYQIAKCFRDEDLRADRQPEFTQLDLEMSFASGSDVMEQITRIIHTLWKVFLKTDLRSPFQTMTYNTAMTSFGSDKPDLRLSAPLHRVEHILPSDLLGKISDLHMPIVEALVLKLASPEDLNDPQATTTRNFVNSFLDSPAAAPFHSNPHGAPGIFVYDPLAPLRGLSAFGFEAASTLEELLDPDEGTLIVLQARPDTPVSGGSTSLGNLRSLLLKAAFKQGLLAPAIAYAPLWVTDFPLFTPTEHNPDEGQASPTGLSSTHHPFTSPRTSHDVSLLSSTPEKAIADHYDLVINGVELGGGSRRIHNASFQTYILKDILKLPEERLKDFGHLIKVLKAGCPPHAGFALGFDRLVAMMMGKESVRDVIAFPKSSGGEDKCMGSPTNLRKEELERYGLKLVK